MTDCEIAFTKLALAPDAGSIFATFWHAGIPYATEFFVETVAQPGDTAPMIAERIRRVCMEYRRKLELILSLSSNWTGFQQFELALQKNIVIQLTVFSTSRAVWNYRCCDQHQEISIRFTHWTQCLQWIDLGSGGLSLDGKNKLIQATISDFKQRSRAALLPHGAIQQFLDSVPVDERAAMLEKLANAGYQVTAL